MNCPDLMILACLLVGSLPSVLGIMCKKCTPSASPVVLCNDPSQITEVNCDDEAALAPDVTFDACTSGKVVASAGTTFVYECTVKNSSDSSLFNCTTTQERICLDAQSRLSSLPIPGVTISSCIAKCCDTNNCNVPVLIDSAPTPDSPTTKAKNGLGQIQSFTSLVSCQLILTFWFKQCI
ncbi:hypothetical protein ABFA07_002848 [Porites harrisoni]